MLISCFLYVVGQVNWFISLITFYIPTEIGFNVNLVVLDDSKIDQTDPFFEFKVVEFLIFSHILGYIVPHPFPKKVDRTNSESILGTHFQCLETEDNLQLTNDKHNEILNIY